MMMANAKWIGDADVGGKRTEVIVGNFAAALFSTCPEGTV